MKILTDREECRKAWEQYTPHKVIHDEFSFRDCFARHLPGSFYFIVLPNGLVPLWKDAEGYSYFGGEFPEQNKLFVKDVDAILPLLPTPLTLDNMAEHASTLLEPQDEEDNGVRYFLPLHQFASFDAVLDTFSAKHRKNIRRDLVAVQSLNPVVGRDEAFDHFVELHRQKFPESNFNDDYYVDSFRDLLVWAKAQGMLRMVTIRISGTVEAVSISLNYKGIFTFLNMASTERNNLGKLLIAETLQEAIREGCTEFDAMSYDLTWKKLWNLQEEQLYCFSAPSSTPRQDG